ncbi:carbohydrate-responsive element-binding protein [Aplochiton taeniatus]
MAMAERMSSGLSGHAKQNHLRDLESDSDPEEEHVPTVGTEPAVGSFLRTQVIHSGHFMVSSPHSDSTPRRRKSGATMGYDFDTVCQTSKFGPLSSGRLSINPTLNWLFECMSLAYSGKIVSPKWKSFKGLRLLWRDKIRLNNGIWRAWFIQYVEKRKNPVCGFVTPLEGSEADAHRKPEAIVLEGSYWKRRIEVVIKEYHKWRIYYKKRLQKNKDGLLSMLQQGPIGRVEPEKWSSQMYKEPEAPSEEAHMFDLDCFLSDISDTLFTMTQNASAWTADRHNTYISNADMIQPGLTPLQPNLDDFMDIPDIFMSYRGQPSEQTAFADFGYLESSSSGAFASAPPPVGTTSQLHGQPLLAQPNVSSNDLRQPAPTHTLPDPGYHRHPLNPEMSFSPVSVPSGPKFKGQLDYGEFQTPSMVPGAMPYEQQPYPGTAVSMATTNASISSDSPFLFPPLCHKYGYHATTASAVTSTVITHTASTVGVAEPQAQGYPTTGSMYTQNPCSPQRYPPGASGFTALTSLNIPHGFSAPQPIDATGVRGKHKQKIAGVKMADPMLSKEVMCLVQQPGSSMRVGGAGASWSSGIPPRGPHPTSSLRHSGPHASSSRGSDMSTLLTQGPSHTNTPLLIPKTEKLSPVQIYGPDRSSLTVSFSRCSGQTSPANLEKTSNPESPRQPGFGKMDSHKTENRRITHISAEQKRRFNIKLGFDTLHSLVTTLSSQPSIKISKATTLHKTAEYIGKMQQERAQLHEETQRLREEILLLNTDINVCQQQLPATGVPITHQRFDSMREKFREYVRAQTLQDWKFWIFSLIIEPLFESYNGMVSTASVEDLCRTTLSWLDQHCSLPALRPMVLSSLRLLSTSTSILTDPSQIPEQATLAVTQRHPVAAQDPYLGPLTQEDTRPV